MLHSWVVVVPVKRLEVAKSRLSAHLGPHRRELALAMALDSVEAAASSPGVRVVVVVDDDAASRAFRPLGVTVVTDEPRAGINAAVVHGAESARPEPGVGIAAMTADLPALRAVELTLALGRASASRPSFVADAEGTGTTLYTAPELAAFTPAYGQKSAARHAAHALAIDGSGLDGLRRDVDTIDDLRVALALGVGLRTRLAVGSFSDLDPRVIRPAS